MVPMILAMLLELLKSTFSNLRKAWEWDHQSSILSHSTEMEERGGPDENHKPKRPMG